MALDQEMGENIWLVAFAPIQLISAGGYIAVSYFKNRDSTGDVDYLMHPEFAADKEIRTAFEQTILAVAKKLEYTRDWINEDMAIFVTDKARQALFEKAEKQNITLFKGENLEILAAPLEWALECKLRRIYNANRSKKRESDLSDAVALLKHLRERNNGPLDMESVRNWNTNGFEIRVDVRTMEKIAELYREGHNEEIFI